MAVMEWRYANGYALFHPRDGGGPAPWKSKRLYTQLGKLLGYS